MKFEYDSNKSESNAAKHGIDFDEKFDAGDDITELLDFSKATRPGREQKRINVDFPVWMIQSLDKEAKRLGIPRQAVIKVWLAERLDAKKHT